MAGQIRIIAGRWKRRKLAFPQSPSLRPTPDRVRETLFNWLAPDLPGARCLDLFAGSGGLGFEAASRGAARVVMVERDSRSAAALRRQRELLGATETEVVAGDALSWLERPPATRFDVVFIDPPYRLNLHAAVCRLLEERGWLRAGARIYLETGRRESRPAVPESWSFVHEKRAGVVRYYLVLRAGG